MPGNPSPGKHLAENTALNPALFVSRLLETGKAPGTRAWLLPLKPPTPCPRSALRCPSPWDGTADRRGAVSASGLELRRSTTLAAGANDGRTAIPRFPRGVWPHPHVMVFMARRHKGRPPTVTIGEPIVPARFLKNDSYSQLKRPHEHNTHRTEPFAFDFNAGIRMQGRTNGVRAGIRCECVVRGHTNALRPAYRPRVRGHFRWIVESHVHCCQNASRIAAGKLDCAHARRRLAEKYL